MYFGIPTWNKCKATFCVISLLLNLFNMPQMTSTVLKNVLEIVNLKGRTKNKPFGVLRIDPLECCLSPPVVLNVPFLYHE